MSNYFYEWFFIDNNGKIITRGPKTKQEAIQKFKNKLNDSNYFLVKKRVYKKIKIKSFFSDWHFVPIEQARQYIKHVFYNGLPCIPSIDEKIKYIEKNRLQGITVKELLHLEGGKQ